MYNYANMTERSTPSEQERRDEWLRELANFVVEANNNTWAAGSAEVEPERPGYKELEYERDDWRLRDSYVGYFRAPGMTTVYYKDRPVWTMQFGGHGQTEGHEDKASETFGFLKNALMKVTPEMPFRGPEEYTEGNRRYTFNLLEGDITDAHWKEEITENGVLTFTQSGLAGIVIPKNSEGVPQLPWNL